MAPYFFFFFKCYGAPQDLHSFPTRRSSDLPAHTRRVNKKSQSSRHHRAGLDRDRKSTRLNSSHRCISYAVFCLKKKKNKNDDKVEMKLKERLQWQVHTRDSHIELTHGRDVD